MGRDGAEGLLKLKSTGAATIAQDAASSTVYGMPKAAYEIGAAKRVLSLEAIATSMLQLFKVVEALNPMDSMWKLHAGTGVKR